MAGAHVAVADDSTAYYWNPAGLSRLDRAQLTASFNQSFQDTRQQNVSLAYPFTRNAVGALFFHRLTVDPFPSLDANGNPNGSVDASDSATGLSYGQRILPFLRLGGTIEVIQETLGPVRDSTIGLNTGLQLRVPQNRGPAWLRSLSAGAAVRHIGDPLQFDQEQTPLPQTTVVGLGFQETFRSDHLTLALDYSFSPDNHPYSAFGMEYWIHRFVAVQSGYRFGPDIENRFRMGFGLLLSRVRLGYSFSPLGDIGTIHRFGFSVNFGRAAPVPSKTVPISIQLAPTPESIPQPAAPPSPSEPARRPDKQKKVFKPMPTTVPELMRGGKALYKKGEFEEASKYFGEVLKRDPNNKEALNLMRKALDRMDYFNVQD